MKPIEDTFQFCPQCSAEVATANAQQAVSANPFRCSKCEYVFYFSPTAAVGGIITDGAKILFLVRGKDPGKGQFGIPGGFVDAGETLEESLTREVLEEASLKVTEMSYLCSFPNQYEYRGVAVQVTDAFFECSVETLDTLSAQATEVQEFRWLEPDAATLNNLAFESNRRAIERCLERRSK